MRVLIALVGIIAAANAVSVSFDDILNEEWKTFKLTHKKEYKNDVEEEFRKKIFLENKQEIAEHNQKYEKGLVSFKLGVNEFADLLHDEFKNIMTGFNRNRSHEIQDKSGVMFIRPANVNAPSSIDWREAGAVTPVKNQGSCGSCWAFSATGSLEGQQFRKSGQLISLSEQNLIDCSSSYGNSGCEGGNFNQAFNYIKDNGGIDTEESYPYLGTDDTCKFDEANIGATVTGFTNIRASDEGDLMEAVATIGPVSVAIDASQDSFQLYSKGIYDEANCSSESTDHDVLVVGYGTEDGTDYWLVKNSWGTSWGEEGYIKMSRNKNNQCGIATSAGYPLV